jgi:cathepsin L
MNTKLLLFLLFAVVIGVCASSPITQFFSTKDSDWVAYKAKHKKSYQNQNEETMRKGNWIKTAATVNQHNGEASKGEHLYFLSMNHLSDLTPAEYQNILGFKPWHNNKVGATTTSTKTTTTSKPTTTTTSKPTTTSTTLKTTTSTTKTTTTTTKTTTTTATAANSIDLRTLAGVGPIKDQGQCGSCWAFAANAALEFQYWNKTKSYVSLSEQSLIECSKSNLGCNGGDYEYAYNDIISNNKLSGLESTANYPYRLNTYNNGVSSSCTYSASKSVVSVKSYTNYVNEAQILNAVSNGFVVAVAIDASQVNFQNYASGIFSDTTCSSNPNNANHAVAIVGFGTQNGTPYWIIRNSWNTNWGMQGYMYMKRGVNMCGVGNEGSYPIIP